MPRALAAEALGLPGGTDALPPEDRPVAWPAGRHRTRFGMWDADTASPDGWTGAVMDRLVAREPAPAVIVAGAASGGGESVGAATGTAPVLAGLPEG
jgi:hypothetical protein